VILRILGQGQMEVPEETVAELNELDEALIHAIDKGDEGQFRAALIDLVTKVRQVGKPVADDYIGPSDIILPDTDATLDEVRDLLSEEGLIPG
jgi:hypothetical protein